MYPSLKFDSFSGKPYKYDYSFFTKISLHFSKNGNLNAHLIVSFLIFGLPFLALFSIMIYEKSHLIYTQPLIFLSLIISGAWLFLGPMLIVNWELSFKQFHEQLQEKLIANKKIKTKYINRVYFNDSIVRTIFSSSFSITFCLVIFCSMDVYKLIGLNYGYSDPVFWLSAFLALQIGYTAGFGFWGVFKTIHSILIIRNYHDLHWQVFCSDKKGGLAFIYKFILKTAYTFSVGTVLVPFWLQIAAHSTHNVKIISYALIILYSLSIVSTFIIPSRNITRLIREKLVDSIDKISNSLNAHLKKEENDVEFLKLMATYRYLNEYDIVPIKLLKAIEFTAIAIIPFILCFIEILKLKKD